MFFDRVGLKVCIVLYRVRVGELMVFFALKRSKVFYSYLLSLQLVLCRVAAAKSLHALSLILSADYILLLVL